MKTDDLIRAIAADDHRARGVDALLPALVPVVGLISGAAFLGSMGMRADLAAALDDPNVLLKQAFPVILALGALAFCLRLARPAAPVGASVLGLALVPAALLVAVVVEARRLPQTEWASALMGHSSLVCVSSISIVSLPILAVSLWTMRRGATLRPALAGAAAGLLSGATATAAYAFYCIEDSPFFYACWYVAAIAAVTAIGALAGSRLLRW